MIDLEPVTLALKLLDAETETDRLSERVGVFIVDALLDVDIDFVFEMEDDRVLDDEGSGASSSLLSQPGLRDGEVDLAGVLDTLGYVGPSSSLGVTARHSSMNASRAA